MTYPEFEGRTPSEEAADLQNDARTCQPIGTGLTQPRSPSVLGYTYFVRDGDFIKIGSSMTPASRIKSLQTAIARELEVLAVVPMEFADELQTHQRFAHLRERGEWFRSNPELIGFITAVKEQAERRVPFTDRAPVLAVPRFKIKVPQTLDQATKLKAWLDSILHTLSGKPHRFASNMAYQIKGARTQADLDRLQPFMAYQSRRLAEASR